MPVLGVVKIYLAYP